MVKRGCLCLCLVSLLCWTLGCGKTTKTQTLWEEPGAKVAVVLIETSVPLKHHGYHLELRVKGKPPIKFLGPRFVQDAEGRWRPQQKWEYSEAPFIPVGSHESTEWKRAIGYLPKESFTLEEAEEIATLLGSVDRKVHGIDGLRLGKESDYARRFAKPGSTTAVVVPIDGFWCLEHEGHSRSMGGGKDRPGTLYYSGYNKEDSMPTLAEMASYQDESGVKFGDAFVLTSNDSPATSATPTAHNSQ